MNKKLSIIIGVIILAVIVIATYFDLWTIFQLQKAQAPQSSPPVQQPAVNNGNAPVTTNEQSQASAPNAPASAAEQKTIIYTSSGFSPLVLKIKAGNAAQFVNQSSDVFWPASAMHPTHAVYPVKGGCIDSVFDACQPILAGQSWSFTFTEKGDWKYHNHLNPSQRGAVVVE